MTTIGANLQQVRARITQACAASGREASGVALLAVSKTFDVDAVIEGAGREGVAQGVHQGTFGDA